MENEIWKPVVGYEELYEVSNMGRVKSIKKDKILTLRDNGRGYLAIILYNCGKAKWSYAHRLVARAFIPNPLSKKCVNHKDESRSNNKLSNLEWVTYKENLLYGTRSAKAIIAKSKPIIVYDLSMNLIGEYSSQKEASKTLNISEENISRLLSGKTKTNKKYILKRKGL